MENNRYKFYRLGQDAESEKKYEKAIEYYLTYSTYLEEKDKHIPLIWIHNIHFSKERFEEAKDFLLEYCKGCSFPYASKILKEKVQTYEEVNQFKISMLLKDESKDYQKKQIEKLKQKT